MPSADNLAHVEAHRAHELGVSPEALHGARITVVPHGEAFAAYHGVYALRSSDALVITAPGDLCHALSSAVADCGATEVFDASFLSAALDPPVERVIGPAWIGFADATDARAHDVGVARQLTARDADSLRRLQGACTTTEWDHSGITAKSVPIFGVYVDGALVAAASWKVQSELIRHVGFVTDPAYRGRGFGSTVAAAITAFGVAQHLILQWQTLVANAPSLAVGRALGYQHRFDSLALRLRTKDRRVVSGRPNY